MAKYPEQYRFGDWEQDISDDYRRADDDTRRRILLDVGYDRSHAGEVLRLFGPPASDSPAACDSCCDVGSLPDDAPKPCEAKDPDHRHQDDGRRFHHRFRWRLRSRFLRFRFVSSAPGSL